MKKVLILLACVTFLVAKPQTSEAILLAEVVLYENLPVNFGQASIGAGYLSEVGIGIRENLASGATFSSELLPTDADFSRFSELLTNGVDEENFVSSYVLTNVIFIGDFYSDSELFGVTPASLNGIDFNGYNITSLELIARPTTPTAQRYEALFRVNGDLASPNAIPEPTTAGLFGLGMLGLIRKRKH